MWRRVFLVIEVQNHSATRAFSSSRSADLSAVALAKEEPLELKRVPWSALKPHIDVFEADGKVRTGLLVGNNPVNETDPDGLGIVDCVAKIAELAVAEAKLAARIAENAACPDPGHDRAIENLKNRVNNLRKQVAKHCTDKDTLAQLAIIGTAALVIKKITGGVLVFTPAAPAGALLLATP